MSTGILSPELRSIEQLFTTDTRYSVPKYQRSFDWGEDETEELWNDLVAAATRSADYFLGTVVLHKKNNLPHEIIDGQQRLVCISMIFSAIRHYFETKADPRASQIALTFLAAKDFSKDSEQKPKLHLNEINNEEFIKYVIEDCDQTKVDDAVRIKNAHESNKKLIRAYSYFLKSLMSECAKGDVHAEKFIVGLIDCLRSRVKMITISVASEDDANQFFETLNARGKELAVSDLIKNRLYFEAKGQVKRVQSLWNQMEGDLVRRPIPDYLRHFWIARMAKPPDLIVREKQLYRLIARSLSEEETTAISLLQELSQSAKSYASISDYTLWPNDNEYGTDFKRTIEELRLFRVSQCNPLLLNAIMHFKKPKLVAQTFRHIVNFSFRYFIIGNQSPGNIERETVAIAHEIRNGTFKKPASVAKALKKISSDRTFVTDFELHRFSKSSSRLARYTLAKLNNHMTQSQGGEQVVNDDEKRVNLEHILPQSLPGSWKNTFGHNIDPADYVYRVGNLTLLRNPSNKDLEDKPFKDKKAILDSSTLQLNQFFKSTSKWTEKEIDQRQKDFANLATAIWPL